jgi:hypothetical protein
LLINLLIGSLNRHKDTTQRKIFLPQVATSCNFPVPLEIF